MSDHIQFSEKQLAVVTFGKRQGKHISTCGATRSGKSFACIAGFFGYTQSLDEPHRHLILGRKIKTLENEHLPQFKEMAEAFEVSFHYNKKDRILFIGQQIYLLFGGEDEATKEDFQGQTIHSVWHDECTVSPENFFEMGVSRMSFPDSKHFSSYNPGSSRHWLKENWLDKGSIDEHYDFLFDDNPILDDEVKRHLERVHYGAFYDRMVKGQWADNSGRCYPAYYFWENFEEEKKDWKLISTSAGSDYGITGDTTFVWMQKWRSRLDGKIRYYVPKAHRIKGDRVNQKTDQELVSEFMALEARLKIKTLILDKSAASFRAQFRKTEGRNFAIRNSRGEVTPGIRFLAGMLISKDILLGPDTEELQKDFDAHLWDEKKEDVQDEKTPHHAADGFRYVGVDTIGTGSHAVPLPPGL